jgi:hypothetical protein
MRFKIPAWPEHSSIAVMAVLNQSGRWFVVGERFPLLFKGTQFCGICAQIGIERFAADTE